jgi:excisionase family DNA binding protein
MPLTQADRDSLSRSGGRARLALPAEEVADGLGISRATVYRRIADGTIPSLKLGRRVVVPVEALERLLVGPPAATPPIAPIPTSHSKLPDRRLRIHTRRPRPGHRSAGEAA